MKAQPQPAHEKPLATPIAKPIVAGGDEPLRPEPGPCERRQVSMQAVLKGVNWYNPASSSNAAQTALFGMTIMGDNKPCSVRAT